MRITDGAYAQLNESFSHHHRELDRKLSESSDSLWSACGWTLVLYLLAVILPYILHSLRKK